jgi:hypothetical protein
MTTKPHVFGHLYMAVFSNGTVKAGMSKRDPQSRVAAHAHAGRAFGISMDAPFFATIYTNDVKARERQMHAAIGDVAAPTAGREWFKFAGAADALNFASAYLHKIERMSFAERPAHEDVQLMFAKRSTDVSKVIEGMGHALGLRDREQKSQRDIAEAEAMLDTLKPYFIAELAGRAVDLENWYSEQNENFDSGMPELEASIIENYLGLYSAAIAMSGEELADADRGISVKNIRAARKILTAAMQYPQFFTEVCLAKLRQNEEVPA